MKEGNNRIKRTQNEGRNKKRTKVGYAGTEEGGGGID